MAKIIAIDGNKRTDPKNSKQKSQSKIRLAFLKIIRESFSSLIF